MTFPRIRAFAVFSAFLLLGLPAIEAQQRSRISGRLDNSRRVSLAGRVHRLARAQNDLGPVASGFELPAVTLVLKPSTEGEAALTRLLAEQQDPASPNFHKWLTPEQYGEQFGASPSDLKQITDWAQAQGLTISQVARGRNWVTLSGTAENVRTAFGAEIHRYQVDGVLHFANANDPSVPAAMASVVAGIRGLNDFRLKPRIRKPSPNTTLSGQHHLAPADIAKIYNISPLYDAGVDGTGVKIVVVGQSAIVDSDVAKFRSTFNLPPIDLQKVTVGRRPPGVISGDVDEAHLDIEWSGAIAPKASIVYVYTNNVWDSAQYAVDNRLGDVLTMSYGACEQMDMVDLPSQQQTAQQATAQGMTWFAASGDTAAGDCEDRGSAIAQNGFAVDVPASIPEVTAMGGTMLDEQGGAFWTGPNGVATGYIPERAWNETNFGELSGGGGGASLVFPRPSWQNAPGVPNDGARHVPDLSLSSAVGHDGYVIYSSGQIFVGGTSVAAPIMAGITALLNHYLVSTGAAPQPGLGNINPTLYKLAQTSTNVFHDVVNGDNNVPCAAGTPDCVNGSFGHTAAAGYDMATGLGSVDAFNLVHAWSSHAPIASAVVPLIDQTPVFQTAGAWTFTLTLNEEAGIGTTLTDFTVDGVSRAAEIPALFKTASIGPRGSISAKLTLTSIAAPKTVVFGFKGLDVGTNTAWTTQFSVPFQGPQIHLAIGGISNAASGQQVYAPGMILSVYGAGMGNFAQSAAAIPLPQFLAGFEAQVNGVPAPLYYVSPNQVNLQIPYETQPGPATLTLGNPFENSPPFRFTVGSTGPGIFTFPDGAINPSRSARRGDVAILFLTGDGAVKPSIATGTTPRSTTPLTSLPKPTAAVSITVGGVPVPQPLDFMGIPSGLVGVTQINFRIPASVPPGVQDVVVTVGGQASNTGKITVQ